MGFSHVCCPDGLSNTLLLKGYILKMTSSAGRVGRMYIPRAGPWVEPLIAWVPLES